MLVKRNINVYDGVTQKINKINDKKLKLSIKIQQIKIPKRSIKI